VELNRRQTYLSILAAGIVICLLYQSIWIFSRTTTAEIYSVYIPKSGSNTKASWMNASYTINYDKYYGSYLIDGFDVNKRFFKIRYLIFNPNISRSDNFVSSWGVVIVFFIIWTIITSIVFIRKDIVSDGAVFIFQKHSPFIRIRNNVIEDYDEHDIENQQLDETQHALKLKLQSEAIAAPAGNIKASVYKYNPNAIGIIIVYVFFFFWFWISVLTLSFSYPQIFIFGAIMIFVPPYVKYTRNQAFKMEIPDEGSLVFSPNGIWYKGNMFELEAIESVVVYLESFRGFEYRDRVTTGNIKTISNGDNNKISFRYKGEVSDLIFILNNARDYWAFKNMMTNWAQRGINVYLQKVFEDDFIIQEMVHFQV